MVYTNNVPQGNQQIASTQPTIQANFGFLNTGLAVEHNFNAAGSGNDMYHLKASMPNQADPGALPAGTNGQYYVSNGGARFYDGSTVCKLTEGSAVTNGYQWIGKVLLQWGTVADNSNTNTTVTFPTSFPTACLNISLTRQRANSSPGSSFGFWVVEGSQTTTQFQIRNDDGHSYGYFWMAIGN